MKLEEENTNKAATMMYFTDHRAAKQTRLGLGTVQNQIHPKSLGWPSGSHNHKVNLPRPLQKFTRGIYNLASLKPLLSRLTLETESSKALSGIVFMPAQKLSAGLYCEHCRRICGYGAPCAQFILRQNAILVSLNECSTRYKNP